MSKINISTLDIFVFNRCFMMDAPSSDRVSVPSLLLLSVDRCCVKSDPSGRILASGGRILRNNQKRSAQTNLV
jgi:hypothetical protein